jgi:hypothetical protein
MLYLEDLLMKNRKPQHKQIETTNAKTFFFSIYMYQVVGNMYENIYQIIYQIIFIASITFIISEKIRIFFFGK